MNNQNKDQVRSQITEASNILVAVSSNPSVDELAASIGLTLALNKLDKHATAVFSGAVPSTIEFLQPEHTIETNTNSLRDFIIALDKSKADKLRYKVEDEVVRIFITPYRTSITQDDLDFTQGDFNVDLVIALGVGRREDLDTAITAHGRILHDATVVSLSNEQQQSELGSIHWQEIQASSLCEMVTVIVAELGQNILDEQMSTALLTGIVAETNRFKNQKTSPLTLSLSSQLMSAGANQQLIAEKLEEASVPEQSAQQPAYSAQDPQQADTVQEGFNTPHPTYANPTEEETPAPKSDGSLSINHVGSEDETLEDIHIDEHGTLKLQQNDLSDQALPEPAQEVPGTPASGKPVPMPPVHSAYADEEPKTESGYLQESASDKPHKKDTAASDISPGDSESEKPAPGASKTNQATMKHERVITPSSDSELAAEKKKIHTDKPFDLMEAEITPGQIQQVQPSAPLDSPVGGAAPPEQTLSALEKAVESPHVNDQPADPKLDVAALSSKALQAADSVAPQFPTPQQALRATPVEMAAAEQPTEPAKTGPKTETKADSKVDPKVDPPPSVPPPMAPQFYDADGKNQNPFLNPSA